MRLFNTATHRIDTFAPIDPSQVRMYCCGPTVYAYAQVGNLRTFVLENILRRSLSCSGTSLTLATYSPTPIRTTTKWKLPRVASRLGN
jgi:cysteinyl-tRNA synthetase